MLDEMRTFVVLAESGSVGFGKMHRGWRTRTS
jgi:hypothetical protein